MEKNSTSKIVSTLSVADFAPSGTVSDEVTDTVTIVNVLTISTFLSFFGVVANVINILTFAKMGFQDTVTMNLFAMAISDILACITMLWTAICYNPLMINSDVPFISYEVDFLTGLGPHVMAMNASALIIAFVTVERCICITYPLKVKAIFTRTRTKAYIVSVFLLVVVQKIPIYYTSRLDWKFVPDRNKTLLGLVFVENRETIEKITFYLSDFAFLILSFCVVIIGTSILIIKLRQKQQWRQRSATTSKQEDTTDRDKRVIKMVVFVAAIFITNFTPCVVATILSVAEPEFSVSGKYSNNFIVALNFVSVFESLNASMNIFVYYRMSTKYRLVFREIFCREKQT